MCELSRFEVYGGVKELKQVAKERHFLFILDVKKVREDVNFMLQELREDMAKEIASVHQDYGSLHKKVDIICDSQIFVDVISLLK